MNLHQFVLPMMTGVVVGLLNRILLVQTSYRQFPSKPHGMIVHLFLGFVASLLGALIIPAVFKPDFTAGVFVSIGTAQFHTIRGLEREAWRDLDKGEPVPRGPAYIDGMAVAFEARIFMVIAASALTTLLSYFINWPVGLLSGIILAIVIRIWKQGKSVAQLAKVSIGKIVMNEHRAFVDDIEVNVMTNSTDALPSELIVVVVEPDNLSGILTLAHHGQQQAMLHNLSIAVGIQAHATLKPTVTYYPLYKKLILLILPIVADEETALEAVAGAPILEGVVHHAMKRKRR